MKYILCFLLLCFSIISFSQEEPKPAIVKINREEAPTLKEEVYPIADKDPQFPGGMIALQEFLVKNLHYPEEAMEHVDQGNVYVEFVVETDGEITNIQIVKSVSRELDKEAKRLIQLMPNWIPGEMNGEKIRTRVRLPVKFVMY